MNVANMPNTDMERLLYAEFFKAISGTENCSLLRKSDELPAFRKPDEQDKEYFDNLELSQEYQDFKNSFDISKMDFHRLFRMSCGLYPISLDENKLAQHLGEIGKNIDEAYSQGKFTKEEYDLLNEELAKYSEMAISGQERYRAWRGEHEKNPIANFYGKQKSMQQIKEEMDAPDPAISKKYDIYRIDRNLIWEMINKYRYGTDVKMQLLSSIGK
jgi:hypothetical protein